VRFAKMDYLPVVFAGQGIDVALAQEADLVGIHQLIH